MPDARARDGRRGEHLVTPEAVPLDLPLADIGTRSVAFAIDFGLQLAIILLLVFLGALADLGPGPALPGWAVAVVVLLATFGVWWGYPIAFETLWRGRTLGKAAMGLRVVTVEGAPVGFRHATIRAVLGLVDFLLLLGGVAVVTALVSNRNQRLGDLTAGTLVVRERRSAGQPRAETFTVPAGAEGYAATIDPSPLRPADYQAVRQFLLRAPDLPPQVRADVAERLASALGDRIGHVRPPELSAELFLRCLAARYQQRRWPAASPAQAAEPSAPHRAAGSSAPGSSAPGDPPAPGGFIPPA